jgi:hypothetical protein
MLYSYLSMLFDNYSLIGLYTLMKLLCDIDELFSSLAYNFYIKSISNEILFLILDKWPFSFSISIMSIFLTFLNSKNFSINPREFLFVLFAHLTTYYKKLVFLSNPLIELINSKDVSLNPFKFPLLFLL